MNCIYTDFNNIVRDQCKRLHNSNKFINFVNGQYDEHFAIDGAKIGSILRIRLPNDYHITNSVFVPSKPAIIGIKETVILGTAAILIKNPEVSRRFWSGWNK